MTTEDLDLIIEAVRCSIKRIEVISYPWEHDPSRRELVTMGVIDGDDLIHLLEWYKKNF